MQRSRCAAIGGSEVRQTTMNILKFLLTNDLAQKFNWAGKDKIAFKVTTTAGLIKGKKLVLVVKIRYNILAIFIES